MWQLWILNKSSAYQKVGPPLPHAEAERWFRVLAGHFGAAVRLLVEGEE